MSALSFHGLMHRKGIFGANLVEPRLKLLVWAPCRVYDLEHKHKTLQHSALKVCAAHTWA